MSLPLPSIAMNLESLKVLGRTKKAKIPLVPFIFSSVKSTTV